MRTVGTEWLIDASGCDPGALGDVGRLRAVFARAIAELGLHPLGEPNWHKFPEPGGVTGLVMLTESHLACHTYPEFGTASFNLYCCRERPDWPWEERLREMLGARGVRVARVAREAPESDQEEEERARRPGDREGRVTADEGDAGAARRAFPRKGEA